MEAPEYYRSMAETATAEADTAVTAAQRKAWRKLAAKWLELGQAVGDLQAQLGMGPHDIVESARHH
jgi:hypothetical protein